MLIIKQETNKNKFLKKSLLRQAEVKQVYQECSIFGNKIEKIMYYFRHISWNASQV